MHCYNLSPMIQQEHKRAVKNTNKHQTPWQNFEAHLLTMVDEGVYQP